ncbi:MAG: siroheme synthase CysG, partial [Proteobacteria bacterium]|nr:siroheme synthase CysG [Pseudomonadota bacterium]
GAAPVLARQIRATVEALLPASLGQLATAADRLRAQVRDRIPAIDARRRFWTGFFRNWRSDSLLARKGAPSAIDAAAIDRFLTAPAQAGRVAIVGAGPGDPDLLTLKALQFLQDADVIVHDRLVGPGVLDYARRDAETIYVGKAPGKHSHSQDEINVLLAHHAGLGKQVVRLKGGDPFIFGRGGEERAYLAERGIEVTIVPGITAAAGCAAAAGIPLTHRGTAQSVTYLTGAAAGDFPDYDWPALARTGGTLVIYMGVGTAKIIATRLIENGLAAATPVAVIENGTLPTQRTVTGTLGGLGALVRREGIQSPALLLIGEVVAQADITAGNRLVTAGHGCVMTYNDKEGSIMQGKVLTANILIDGIVVYLAAGDAWTAKLPEARFLTDESEQKRLMHIAEQDVERRIIVDPYLMDAEGGADGPEPVSQRERIRATGPTIPTHFNTSPSES